MGVLVHGAAFEELDGILSVRSGYTGGHVPHPTYEQVKAHQTGHTEAVEIIFDEHVISYADLVEIYWAQTDPTDAFGQFEDRGDNYRPVIFMKTTSNVASQSNPNKPYKSQDVFIHLS